jgi:hypothetical protein
VWAIFTLREKLARSGQPSNGHPILPLITNPGMAQDCGDLTYVRVMGTTWSSLINAAFPSPGPLASQRRQIPLPLQSGRPSCLIHQRGLCLVRPARAADAGPLAAGLADRAAIRVIGDVAVGGDGGITPSSRRLLLP